MSVVYVGFPVTRVKTRLTLYQGRPWSVVEHLILEAVCREPLFADELAQGLNLPRAIVDESVVKLMRAAWMQMDSASADRLRLVATPFGAAAAAQPMLPTLTRSVRRDRWQLFDGLYGHVFGLGELAHVRRDELTQRPDFTPIVVLDALLFEGEYRRDELIEVALEEGEQLIGVDPTSEYSSDRVAIVKVVDGEIDGLPTTRPLSDLESAIRAAAAKHSQGTSARAAPLSRRVPRAATSKWHDVCVEPNDIVIGGPAHREALETLLRTARSRIIIHSTFLREQPFRLLLPLLLNAVKRNVAIDILHGKDHGADDEASAAVQAVRHLRRDPDIMAYRERFRLHSESTRSHAKVIVADPHRRGQLVALVSSCNWLDTPFKRIEAGIYLRDPALVREVLHCLMRLVAPGSGVSPQLATDLFRLGQALPPPDPARRPNGKATLVIGDAHNAHVLRARDTVRHDLLLTSHKLGQQFDAGALIPLARACERRRVRVRMIYSTLRGIDKEEESQFRRDAQANRIALTPERDPQVHAKLLAWDRNDAVITSQNWLSADPGYTPLATELGVAVQCPGVGSWVMDAFAQVLVAQRRRRPSWRGRRQQVRPE